MKTDITVVLDRSGSMYGITDDTIGGVNQFIEDQRKLEGKCRISIFQFNDKVIPTHVDEKVDDIKLLDKESYHPGGSTALYDAIGIAIDDMTSRRKGWKKILFVVTDGEENSSVEYTHETVKKLIGKVEKKWQVIFMGGNIDVAAVGGSIGISCHKMMRFSVEPKQCRALYDTVSEKVSAFRSELSEDISFSDEDRELVK